MADQKRWFKVWTSIVSDDDFDPSRPSGLVGLGRFSILGAYTALHGQKGRVEIMLDTLLRLTQAHDLDTLRGDLALKNVRFEEGKNRHGKVTVTWNKWIKYQEDSTQALRAKTSRDKKRGEEIRGDETRREDGSYQNKNQNRAAPEPSAGRSKRNDSEEDTKKKRSMDLSPELQEQTDRLYQSDPKKFQRLVLWVNQGRKHKFSESNMAEALRQFWKYRTVDNWYAYLDTILDNVVKNRNRDEFLELHEANKRDPKLNGGDPLLDVVRKVAHAKEIK